MRGVVKRFGGVQALRGVDFDLQPGEIHALLGENCGGKSTLMNILSGVIEPDAGEVRIDGASVRFADPRAAQAAGVATIFQELDLVPGLDVTANLFLGRELTRAGVLDRATMRREARSRLEAVGVEIDVDQPVGELSVGRRQIVAIAKALTYASRILVMDEPTAALTAAEVERLFTVMREIAGRGVGIVYISHRLEEVPRVADRVTVLRERPGRRNRARERPAIGTRGACSSAGRSTRIFSRSGKFGRPVLRLEHAGFRRTPRAPAGRSRLTFRSKCARAKSSALPGSWARAAPSSSPRSTARVRRGPWSGPSRSTARRRISPRFAAPAARASASSPTTGAAGSHAARQRRAQSGADGAA